MKTSVSLTPSTISDCLEASDQCFASLFLPTLQCINSQALRSGARNTKLTDVVVSSKEIAMEGRYQDTHNTKEYALFDKVGRMYTKYRSSGVFQRLFERGVCYKFMIETGNINFSSYKTLYMYSKKYYSPISCHRHGRNEIKQERLVTWSQEAPSPFWATESIWQVYSTDKCWVYQRAEPETQIQYF